MIKTKSIAGIEYSKNIDTFEGKSLAGSIRIFPNNAIPTAASATNKLIQLATSGRGNLALFIFKNALPIANNAITERKEIV